MKGMSVELRVGETLRLIGGEARQAVKITLLEKSGQRARVSVDAPDSVKIERPQQNRKDKT